MRRTFALALTPLTLALFSLPFASAQAPAGQASASHSPATAAPSANDAAKRAKVEQMLTVTRVDALSQQMLASVPDRVKTAASRQMIVQSASTPEQKKLTSDYLDQMQSIARSGATWSTIKPKIIDLYMAAFTDADLDGILAFYKTPAGQDLIAKTPEISGKTIETLQASVSALQPQFEAASKAYQTSMQNTAPAAGSSGSGSSSKPPTLGPDTSSKPTLTPRQ